VRRARLPRPAGRVYLVMRAVQDPANAVMFTVYVVYFVQAAHFDPRQLVLVGTVLELTCFLFEVPTGVVADVYSRRLSVIVGIALLGVSFVLTGAVPVFAAILLAQVIAAVDLIIADAPPLPDPNFRRFRGESGFPPMAAVLVSSWKAAGMSESALVADRQSAGGATRLCESCGFQVIRWSVLYRKPL